MTKPRAPYLPARPERDRGEDLFAELNAAIEEGSETMPVRRFREFRYRTPKRRSRSRRVIGKAEVLRQGQNSRFIATNLSEQGWDLQSRNRFRTAEIYEGFCCARGDMENRIKEPQLDLFADRTSTHWMASDPWRRWFSAFAHWIVLVLRAEVLPGTSWARRRSDRFAQTSSKSAPEFR
jgi:hypothetical protein